MRTIRHLLLFTATALFLAACGSSGELFGSVAVDVTPNDATVVLSDGDGVVAQRIGSGTLGGLSAGEYQLIVEAAGYDTVTRAVTVVANQTASVPVRLTTAGADPAGDMTGDDTKDPVDEPADLVVTVKDGDGAPVAASIEVFDVDDALVASASDVDMRTFEDLEAGTYVVRVEADGYLDWGPQAVSLKGGKVFELDVRMRAKGGVGGSANAIHLDFVDERGYRYDTRREVNVTKDVVLLAAQTEEMVGVTVLVKDKHGNPLRNAPVTVNVTGDFTDALAIYPGRPNRVSKSSNAFQGLMTDHEGKTYFIIEATNAKLSIQELLGFIVGDGEIMEPVKLIVSATGDDNVAVREEFKVFFTDMTHLFYGELDLRNGVAFSTEGYYADPELVYTEQRVGGDLGVIKNAWYDDPFGDLVTLGGRYEQDLTNAHFFGTFAHKKQPSYGPFPVGIGLREVFTPLVGQDDALAPSEYNDALGIPFPGVMVYEIEDGEENVEWVHGACEFHGPLPDHGPLEEILGNAVGEEAFQKLQDGLRDGTICIDVDGSGVGLVPDGDIDVEDLPVAADVHATYWFVVPYGARGLFGDYLPAGSGRDGEFTQPVYAFALKDYRFTKKWVGGWLEIDKEVKNHVLTWAGPDVTLPATNAEGASEYPFRTKYTITVRNPSKFPVHNATVFDELPRELGVVLKDHLVVEGHDGEVGTYDDGHHAITWSYKRNSALEKIDPGAEVQLTFYVYARHKPGYEWQQPTEEEIDYKVESSVANHAYGDPYAVTNGAWEYSVGVSGYRVPEVTEYAPRTRAYYEPYEDESTIWVVRPIFDLDKVRLSSQTMLEGDHATFEITVRQTDRTAYEGPYADLAYAYPDEFGGKRTNPYARKIRVADEWSSNLDFTDATPFTNGVEVDEDASQDGIVWKTFPVFGPHVEFRAEIELNGLKEGEAVNTAYLWGPQLNQKNVERTCGDRSTVCLIDRARVYIHPLN